MPLPKCHLGLAASFVDRLLDCPCITLMYISTYVRYYVIASALQLQLRFCQLATNTPASSINYHVYCSITTGHSYYGEILVP